MSEKLAIQTLARVLEDTADSLEFGFSQKKTRVGITIYGSELGVEEVMLGAQLAQDKNPDIEIVVIGSGVQTDLEVVEASSEEEAHELMDKMLASGEIEASVTMHYNFPLGVSTVGRVITPARGKDMYIATTTGVSDTDRIISMLKNTIYAIATAKACGNENPSVGILNVDGARQVERILKQLKEKGYPINFANSGRSDEGVVMRGNDLIMGTPDIMVTDSLSGNIFMKIFSAYVTGGKYEALGYGYGPGIGEDYKKVICIISRASGAPVIAGALKFAAESASGNVVSKVKEEFTSVRKAGWAEALDSLKSKPATEQEEKVAAPPQKVVTEEIPGIEILEIEDAVQSLWKNKIYAESGMGCTGPIVQVAEEDKDKALEILKEKNYI
ncbi:glycine/sarcosine/betaine reductase complex component C subunit alpha [Candidatus Contubernalis alkaliaceticus]|uniref:glycine/sarcosine/betaine reductase complex component C subunit alpha n=1 Tax=Candidatus Contubernalis alkaliaceticus TaxID=338645 RepID=UPI001F4C2792|nr:glycine/sarcosine/betaine reductase complex component C subunit alpha [Candidatus Contubernalis alkalaceticus]UNC92922.1 glycine reductase [Candidatus Contubernalis alkalaceticus]